MKRNWVLSPLDNIPQAAAPTPGTTLSALISANSKYTKLFNWTISKGVTPDKWDLFTGDIGTSQYTITVNKDQGTNTATISGQVYVKNGGSVATQGLAIILSLQVNAGGGFMGVPLPPPQTVVDLDGFSTLLPNQDHYYDYSINIPTAWIAPGGTYKVTANVTITNHAGHIGTPFGPSPSADTILGTVATPVHNTISVIDSYKGNIGTTSSSYTWSYVRDFNCSNEGINKNIATIYYTDDSTTGPSDSASVTVNCYKLNVSKNALTSYKRTYPWTIDKTVSETGLDNTFAKIIDFTLAINETHTAYYKVNAIPGTPIDSNFMAYGTITISNPAPIDAYVLNVTDSISGVGEVLVTCGSLEGFPPTLPAGATTECSYTTSLGDKTTRTNTATVQLQNHHYYYNGMVESAGTTNFTGEAQVIFSQFPTSEEDKCIAITDDHVPGTLGTASATDVSTQTIYYNGTIGPYVSCGSYFVTNTATFKPIPCGDSTASNATGTSSSTVNVTVPCNGCTHTIGFWKTHAGFTGNNPDLITPLLPIWLGTPSGPRSVYVQSSSQAVNILDLSGDASNGINKLYAQLLAAKLNIAYGASSIPVSTVISDADTFLATHNATDWAGLDDTTKNQVLSWATTLDMYNNGLLGVPHCSESGDTECHCCHHMKCHCRHDMECHCCEEDHICCHGTTINLEDCNNVKIIINKDGHCNCDENS